MGQAIRPGPDHRNATVTKSLRLAAALILLPFAAAALPAVGEVVGTNPTDATAALAKAGCMVQEYEAKNRKIEAKCIDTDKMRWEIYINPQNGVVTQVKADD